MGIDPTNNPPLLEYYHFAHFPEKQSSFSCEFVAARVDPIGNNERDYNRRGRAARGENPLAPCAQHTSPIRTPLDPRWRHIGPRRIATKVDVSISHDRNEQRHAVVTPMSILLSLGNVVGSRIYYSNKGSLSLYTLDSARIYQDYSRAPFTSVSFGLTSFLSSVSLVVHMYV